MAETLEYATPQQRPVTPGIYRTVLVCGWLPMSVGVGTLVLYLLLRIDFLPILGFFWIGIGTLLIGIGLILLAIHYWQLRRSGIVDRKARHKRAGLATLLLLANFPLAYACAVIGSREMSRSFVIIENTGTATIDSFVLKLRSPVEFGPIPPGTTARKSFMEGLSCPDFTARTGQQVTSGSLGIYSGHMSGGTWRFTFDGKTATTKPSKS